MALMAENELAQQIHQNYSPRAPETHVWHLKMINGWFGRRLPFLLGPFGLFSGANSLLVSTKLWILINLRVIMSSLIDSATIRFLDHIRFPPQSFLG